MLTVILTATTVIAIVADNVKVDCITIFLDPVFIPEYSSVIGLELALRPYCVCVVFWDRLTKCSVSVVYIDMFMLCCDDIKIIDMSNGVF